MSPRHLQGGATFTIGQRSVAGIKAHNEDAIGIRIPDDLLLTTKGSVAIIADGVSAAEAGKEASETCVHNFLSDYYSTPETWSVSKSTGQVLTALNRWLYSQGRQFADAQKGYLTTLSAIVFKSHAAHLLHVGDSRIYRLRNNTLEQLTRDHTTVVNSKQSYLARAMGLDTTLDVDYKEVELQVGDVFLLSTDGLHDFVSDKLLREMVQQTHQSAESDFEACCEQLIQHALANNSNDNISCQLLRIDSLPKLSAEDVHVHLASMPFPPALRTGLSIDGLKVIKELHASSSSHLYLVEDKETKQQYCMKAPSVNYIDDPAYIERFTMETWIGSRLNNPHILKIVETNRKKNHLYYLMEVIEGITLEQWISEHPNPPIQEVLNIVEQVIKGLRAFHRKETLHQDLKPGNIMIDNNDHVKIIDFGSCFVKGIAEIATPLQRDKILGTAAYSAPETVINGDSTAQSDIFAIAVIIFEMLTGKQPFNGKLETCRTQKAYLKTKYIAAYEYNPLVPFWLDGAIRKGLRFDPNKRHADVSELLHELQHPNPNYENNRKQTLIEKNPERFWQVISLLLLFALCISLFS
ncbi:bifunctional protein-serine/threonine kinase/phosphatase [Moritella yayanosii]|uniref:Putative bifunctional serine/threonine kinase and phosphatase n=1 Tax=Moritella yayanosii TaxID=69539 RepID=A0A330LU82_9GAMM|nr:bifunctional protein-serine/threonine kinase/phosphatase [Moritella yayanosii]SQD79826.1 putative bifunctional serine/threonine kinase and phosphatase [Moritella yayanosii]